MEVDGWRVLEIGHRQLILNNKLNYLNTKLTVKNIMGQINCHCQEAELLEQQINQNQRNQLIQTLSHSPSSPLHNICTNVLLKNQQRSMQVSVPHKGSVTVGTGYDCQQRWRLGGGQNQFKVAMRMVGRSVIVKDCGVGLGAFLQKKKLNMTKQRQYFLSIDDHFILFFHTSTKLSYTVFDLLGQQSFETDLDPSPQLAIKGTIFVICIEKEGEECSIRRKDRRGMFVLLTEEQRVRIHDVLRLGSEMYQIGGISCGVEEESKDMPTGRGL